jgi:hypothetical protein
MLSVAKHLCVYSRAQSARDSSEIFRFAQNDITRSTMISAFITVRFPGTISLASPLLKRGEDEGEGFQSAADAKPSPYPLP